MRVPHSSHSFHIKFTLNVGILLFYRCTSKYRNHHSFPIQFDNFGLFFFQWMHFILILIPIVLLSKRCSMMMPMPMLITCFCLDWIEVKCSSASRTSIIIQTNVYRCRLTKGERTDKKGTKSIRNAIVILLMCFFFFKFFIVIQTERQVSLRHAVSDTTFIIFVLFVVV